MKGINLIQKTFNGFLMIRFVNAFMVEGRPQVHDLWWLDKGCHTRQGQEEY